MFTSRYDIPYNKMFKVIVDYLINIPPSSWLEDKRKGEHNLPCHNLKLICTTQQILGQFFRELIELQ